MFLKKCLRFSCILNNYKKLDEHLQIKTCKLNKNEALIFLFKFQMKKDSQKQKL